MAAVSPLAFVLAVGIGVAVSLLVFWHAEKHGSRHATAWGIAAFLFAGLVVPIYFIRYFFSRSRSG